MMEDLFYQRSSPESLAEQLQHLCVQIRISRSQKIRLPNHVLITVKRSQNTSRFSYARSHSSDVPWMHAGIQGDVDVSLAQQGIVNAVHRPAESSSFGIELRKPDFRLSITWVHVCVLEGGRNYEGLGRIGNRRGPQPLWICSLLLQPAALTRRSINGFPKCVRPDHANGRNAAPKISNQRSEERQSNSE